MKKIKLGVAACAAVILALSNVTIMTSAAVDSDAMPKAAVASSKSDASQIIVDTKTAAPGEDVTVALSLKNNPGITGMVLRISYDSTALKLKLVEDKWSNLMYSQTLDVNPYKIMWFDGLNNVKTNGEVCNFTFTVNENAALKDYDIEVSYSEGDICDNLEQDVHFDMVSGKITVKNPTVDVTGVTLTPAKKELKIGETVTLTSKITPDNATDKKVTYKSSNEKIATVDANGKVTAIAEGSADITATTADGKYTATSKITVVHVHNLVKVAKKDATCTENGNIEYYKCEKDGAMFADAEGKKALTESDIVIKAVAHKFGDWNITLAATETAEGVEERVCGDCGKKETRSIPKLNPGDDKPTTDNPGGDKPATDNPGDDKPATDDNPGTGSSASLSAALGALALGAAVVMKKKK